MEADVVFGMEVCYPGGDVSYKTSNCAIVHESKGIDFILGIDWLSKDKGLTNCATKAIKLTTDDRKYWSRW
jgi:hypothetical protein